MEQRVSLITLGVRDLAASAAFYEGLGWQRVESPDGVIAFDLISQTLGLYPLQSLADDLGLDVEMLLRGAMTLGHNLRDKAEVDALFARVDAAGGTIVKPAHEVFWGGYSGYFADPDGHIWELSFNPFSPLSDEGAFRWNGYG